MAKFIELCDICSIHRTKTNKQTNIPKQSEKCTQDVDVSTEPDANTGLHEGTCTFKSQAKDSVTFFDTPHKGNVQDEKENTSTSQGAENLAEKQLDNIVDYIQAMYTNTQLVK